MKVMITAVIFSIMTLGAYTAMAGGACCPSGAKKAEKAECADCGHEKGSQECKDACAAEKCAGCGEIKGSEACKEACAKE